MPPMAEQVQSGAVARDRVADSVVLPIGSAVNEQGHLEVGGCDVLAVAEEFGTPAYIYAEDDLRARARAYREAFERRGVDGEVLFASKAFPATAAYKLFAEEGLSVDVASGGELHLALAAGVNETVNTVDEAALGGTLKETGVTEVTEGVVNGLIGPESVVGKTVNGVGEVVGGLLGGGSH